MEENILIIEVKNGPEDGKIYKFKKKDFPIVIGRDVFGEEKEIPVVYDGFLSRKQAEIKPTDNVFLLKDLNSRNGTMVNDIKVEPGNVGEIVDGTRIRVGSTNLLVRIPSADLSKSVQVLMKSRVL